MPHMERFLDDRTRSPRGQKFRATRTTQNFAPELRSNNSNGLARAESNRGKFPWCGLRSSGRTFWNTPTITSAWERWASFALMICADLSFALGFFRPSITSTLANLAPSATDPQNPRSRCMPFSTTKSIRLWGGENFRSGVRTRKLTPSSRTAIILGRSAVFCAFRYMAITYYWALTNAISAYGMNRTSRAGEVRVIRCLRASLSAIVALMEGVKIYEIRPIAEDNIASFRETLDAVAREQKFLSFLEAPSLEQMW
jgi:hypothetical protein